MRVSSAGYLVKQGIVGVWKNRMMSFASFCIMLVSLMLVGISVLAGININKIVSEIEEKNEMIVVLEDGISEAQIDQLYVDISGISNVTEVTLYSSEEAWENTLEGLTEEARKALEYDDGHSPYPDVFRVKVSDLEIMDITEGQIMTLESVASIQSPKGFADALVSIRNIGALVSSAVIFTLIVICLVIISNTTRTSVHSRRKEINIMKYVGATNTFIRVPFFIEGMLIGILAAIGALILTRFAYMELYHVLSEQLVVLQSIGSLYAFGSIAKYVILSYIVAGTIIGAVGTTISAGKYLKV